MVKYDTLRNTARDESIALYAKAHPEKSLREIGEDFKLSKQRISTILKPYKLGLKKL